MLRKHKKMDKVAAEFLSRPKKRGEGKYEVSVRWWSIEGGQEPWCLGVKEDLLLTKEQLADYVVYKKKGKQDE